MTGLTKRLLGALALFVLLAGGGAAAAQTPVERHGQLRVEGNRVVDVHGRPVILRGMSLFWSQWGGKYYNADVVRWLKQDFNVNVIRAAVAVEPDGLLQDPAREIAKATAVIDAAIAEGLYVVVDWHAHQPHPEAAVIFFEHIARKYGDKPNVLYETYNEPLAEHDWKRVVKPYHLTVGGAIRAIDPDNLILAGTSTWSQDVDVAARDPLPFENVAYVLHFYAATHKGELRDKAQAALDRGAALFVTEWGTTDYSGDGFVDVAETRRWWDFMEKNELSHLNWSVMDKREASAALQPGASAKGGWTVDQLTPSGRLVRERLREMNPK